MPEEISFYASIGVGIFLGGIQVWSMARVGRALVERAGDEKVSSGNYNAMIIIRYMVFVVVFAGCLMFFRNDAIGFLSGLFVGFGLALVRFVRGSKAQSPSS